MVILFTMSPGDWSALKGDMTNTVCYPAQIFLTFKERYAALLKESLMGPLTLPKDPVLRPVYFIFLEAKEYATPKFITTLCFL